MPQLQDIFADNRALCDALERAGDGLQRLCGKMAARAALGGRIYCIGADSGAPQECGAPQGFFRSLEAREGRTAWEHLAAAGITHGDIFLVMDAGCSPVFFADGLRSVSRKGILAACIAADAASAPLAAAQERVCLDAQLSPVMRRHRVKALLQMALDAVLQQTIALSGLGGGEPGAADTSDEFIQSAAAALMAEVPGLDAVGARELILKYGSVRRAQNACKSDVQK